MAQTTVVPAVALLQSLRKVASFIDRSRLRPETTRTQVVRLCQEGLHYGFSTVVHPSYVAIAVSLLRGSSVKAGTPIGFSMGTTR
jgi:deoxyribose-phosphate aldolase